MKIIVIVSIMVLNTCQGSKESVTNMQDDKTMTNIESTNDLTNTQDESLQIEYTAITRGSYKHLVASKGRIHVKKNHSDKGLNIDCTKEQWNKIMSLYNNLKLESMSTLKAPSKASHYDGALAATLKVTREGKIYETSTFDHGNPPMEIKSLVVYILTLSEVE